MAELDPVDLRAKSPWKAFILTGFLASLIGAGGGGYGAYTALKKFSPAPATQTDVDLSPIEMKLKQLTDRVNIVETEAQEAASSPQLETEPVDLSALEDRLTTLETAPSPEIDPAALTALQAAQKDGFEWPDVSTLEGKIAALEAKADTVTETILPENLLDRLTALETHAETVQNTDPVLAIDEGVMSEFNARLSALENRSDVAPKIERVSILAFPKALMIEAVDVNMEGGLIKKVLSRHVRVKSANNPLTLIEGIENDLSQGRLAPAAEKFERLPSPVRSAGQAWYESVKASL